MGRHCGMGHWVFVSTDISQWPSLSDRHQNMYLGKLHTPCSPHPNPESPLCCPHNGNPNTQERFSHANVKSIQEKGGGGSMQFENHRETQRKQGSVKCFWLALLTARCLSIRLPTAYQPDEYTGVWPSAFHMNPNAPLVFGHTALTLTK